MVKKSKKIIGEFLIIAFVSIVILILILKLWNADLSIPFIYGGDALFSGALIKGMIQNGWYLDNPYIGMPTGLNFRDYPLSDNLHFLILKIISLIFPDYGITLNLFYLLTFPLTAITSFFVLRHFGIAFQISLMGSILYTFLPNHFFRNVGHLFLAAYYMVPLMVLVILWIGNERSPLLIGHKKKSISKNVYFWAAIIICLLTSSSGVYFSYFGCFFLLVAGSLATAKQRKSHPLIISIFLILIIIIGTLVNISPSLYHWYKNGQNSEVGKRGFFEPELYGLKITQLLLPIKDHRIPVLAKLKESYNRNAPLVNENDWVSLGIIGSVGFLILIFAIFFDRLRSWNSEVYNLSFLNLSGILVSTIGGFSTLIAFFFPDIRGYNRVSFYLAFFTIYTICAAINHFSIKLSRKHQFFFSFLIYTILILGILDQTSPQFVPPYEGKKNYHREQMQFMSKIESILPNRAMIFQLPYFPFPEHPPINKVHDYDHFGGGYLLSKELRWSYGTIKGREGDLWQRMVTEKPLEEFLETIVMAGFKAIYIDRYGYEDNAKSLEKKIEEIIQKAPFISPNNRYSIYSLIGFEEKLISKYSKKEWQEKKERAIYPLFISWGKGFYGLERNKESNWRWCSQHGILVLNNSWKKIRRVEIKMEIAIGYEEFSNMIISGDLISENFRLNSKGIKFKKDITVPPGKHIIEFQTDAPPIIAPGDLRKLVFRINNFQYKEIM